MPRILAAGSEKNVPCHRPHDVTFRTGIPDATTAIPCFNRQLASWKTNCLVSGMMTQESFAAAYRNGFHTTMRLMLSKGLLIDEAEELAQAAWVRGWEARHN
jgi:hypothetical protein